MVKKSEALVGWVTCAWSDLTTKVAEPGSEFWLYAF